MSIIDLFTKPPPSISSYKPGQLNDAELKQFFEEGYVLVKNYFTEDELLPVIEDLKWLMDRMAKKLFQAGKIKDMYEQADFFERATLLNKDLPGFGILLHKRDHLSKAIRNLWSCEKLLNFAEQVLGTADIMGHPTWNIRCKIPHFQETVVPWHQDHAYLTGEAEMLIPTAWIPLLNTNRSNGCMEVIPNGHRSGKIATHTCCVGPTWYVDLAEEEMKSLGVDAKDAVLCEVPFGGVLFFNNLIPHRSLSNTSDQTRWSLDLRWHKKGTSNCLGVERSVKMRQANNSVPFKIDWAGNIDEIMEKGYNGESVEDTREDDFETVIHGPWMNRWKLVSHNKHTEAFLAEQQKKGTGN